MKSQAIKFLFIFLSISGPLLADPLCHIKAKFLKGPTPGIQGTLEFLPDSNGVEGFYKKETEVTKTSAIPASDRDGIVFLSIQKEQPIYLDFKTDVTKNVSPDGTGVTLIDPWYPVPENECQYTMDLELPEEFIAISEGNTSTESGTNGLKLMQFSGSHPQQMIHLILSSRLKVTEQEVDGVTIATVFSPANQKYSDLYIERAKEAIADFKNLFGPFPYKRFAMVESDEQVGMSMPTFTLLGSRLISLPFLLERSLTHEISHQWFGNYLRTPAGGENWSEGIANLMADMRIEEANGSGAEIRKNALINYQAFVKPEHEFPLEEFVGRYDRASQAIGYGKSAMVFSMVRDRIGEVSFHKALRNLVAEKGGKTLTWDDFQNEFESVSGQNLHEFFRFWIFTKGLPTFQVENASTVSEGDAFRTTFTLKSNFSLPPTPLDVLIKGRDRSTGRRISFSGNSMEVSLITAFLPEEILLDPDYHLARSLAPEEYPPVLSRLFGSNRILFIVDRKDLNRYRTLYELYYGADAKVIPPAEIDYNELKEKDIVFLDRTNSALNPAYNFPGSIGDEETVISVRKSPWNPEKTASLVHSPDPVTLQRNLSRASHYGSVMDLTFQAGKRPGKITPPESNGFPIKPSFSPVDLKEPVSWDSVLTDAILKQSPVIYVGEKHTEMAHHQIQLEVIKKVHGINPGMAIGMEMFTRDMKRNLEDFISGKISEKELLIQTDYYTNWGYDYALYRPILLYARENQIPIIPLNIDRSLVRNVSRNGGIHKIQDASGLPAGMDFSNKGYREFLQQIFTVHMGADEKAFEGFFQAQILWDEAMAESAADWLGTHPSSPMVVLAGNGHLIYRRGVPERVKRRIGGSYITILNDEGEEPGIGDYTVQTTEKLPPPSPTIGVQLKAAENGELEVVRVFDDTAGKKAGILEGDHILELNDIPVPTLNRLKIELFFLEKGKENQVKIRRGEELLQLPIVFEEAAKP